MDLYLPYGGDFQLDPSGMLQTVTGIDESTQRVARRLMTNPAVRNSQGQVLQPADNSFHPDTGAGIGRDVGSTVTSQSAQTRTNRIKREMKNEVTVDPSVSVDINQFFLPNNGALVMQIAWQTANGLRTQIGVAL